MLVDIMLSIFAYFPRSAQGHFAINRVMSQCSQWLSEARRQPDVFCADYSVCLLEEHIIHRPFLDVLIDLIY